MLILSLVTMLDMVDFVEGGCVAYFLLRVPDMTQEKISVIKDLIPKYYGSKRVVTFDNFVIM